MTRVNSGFTLIELMMTVSIVAILALFALPEMRNVILNNRIKDASLNLYSSLTLARSEAIKRNVNIVSMVAASGGWQNGWSVTCVEDNPGGPIYSCGNGGSNAVIGTEGAVDSSISLSGPAGNIVTYNRDGRVSTGSAEFRLTAGANNNVASMRCVNVDASGRPRTRADSNGVDSDGCN